MTFTPTRITEAKEVLGEWYDTTEPTQTDKASDAYECIARINRQWFEKIPIPVAFQSEDPYDSYSEMKRRVQSEGQLRVFSGGTNPTYMSYYDNLIGRAVHDYYGHLERDCDFSMRGEWLKYDHVRGRYPEWVRPLLFTEIVGQRAAVSYYDGGFGDPAFEQKPVFAPNGIRILARSRLGPNVD